MKQLSATIVLIALAGCHSLTGLQLAKDRASREYNCPAESVRAKWLSQAGDDYDIYKVSACGTIVTYACSENKESCIKESDDRRGGDGPR